MSSVRARCLQKVLASYDPPHLFNLFVIGLILTCSKGERGEKWSRFSLEMFVGLDISDVPEKEEQNQRLFD